jgi:hypothetical protein
VLPPGPNTAESCGFTVVVDPLQGMIESNENNNELDLYADRQLRPGKLRSALMIILTWVAIASVFRVLTA